MPDPMAVRRETVEHVFGRLKAWMGSTPFPTKGLTGVRTALSLAVLASNMKRMIRLFGAAQRIQAMLASRSPDGGHSSYRGNLRNFESVRS